MYHENTNWLVTKFLKTNCNVNTIKERDMAILRVASHYHLINSLTQQEEFENFNHTTTPMYSDTNYIRSMIPQNVASYLKLILWSGAFVV